MHRFYTYAAAFGLAVLASQTQASGSLPIDTATTIATVPHQTGR